MVEGADKREISHIEIICSCESHEQFEVVLKRAFVTTIYIDTQMYSVADGKIKGIMDDVEKAHKAGKQLFLRLPVIFRAHTSRKWSEVKSLLSKIPLDGIVVRNYEELEFVKENFPEIKLVIDHNLYTYNDYAKNAFLEYDILRDTMPLELNQKEIRRRNNKNSEMVIYGYYPLMTSAGCVHKNTQSCDKKAGVMYLKDRYNVRFPVKNYCSDCYNVIYNSVPVMLFGEQERLTQYGIYHFRMDFSIETADEVENVLNLYEGAGREIDYTNGHYKRGVE